MDLSNIESQLHRFLIESEDLYWQNWVGLQDDIDIQSMYRKYNAIFSLDSLIMVKQKLEQEPDTDEKNRLRAVLGQLILGRFESLTSDLQQDILKREAATTIPWNKENIPHRTMSIMIGNETDRDKRRIMIDLQDQVVSREINPVREEWAQRLFDAIHELGYANYVELCRHTQDRDFFAFVREMEQFLDDSEQLYLENLDRYLNMETGLKLDDTTHISDLRAVMRCRRFDEHFPPEKLLDTVRKTVGSMGFSMDGIHLDLEDRAKKKPRPCVSAVNPPKDVRLTVYPSAGYDDYAGLLHETGHAIHFIHETPDLNYIYKFWGDRGFTEGTAYLFQNITQNISWLKDIIGIKNPAEFVRFNAFLNILRFRRLIAQFLYQMDLFLSNSLDDMDEIYRKRMERAHGVLFNSSGYLNFDMELYSAGYIRARMFENQLRFYLQNQFGMNWWQKTGTGKYLKSLYINGRKNRADDIVKTLGCNNLDPGEYLSYSANILR